MEIGLPINRFYLTSVANKSDLTFTWQMKEKLSDELLILKYAKGDAEAFEIIYLRHKGGLFRYCLRQFSNRAVAEECFQDIWFKVINNRLNYQPKALFTTYLYRIAQNQVIDIYRKDKKRLADTEFEEDIVNKTVLGDDIVAKEQSDQQHRALILRKQIALLPFEQRNTLLLKLDSGLSLEEIGLVLDCGKETVKSRLRYATKKLRGMLEGSLGAEKDE